VQPLPTSWRDDLSGTFIRALAVFCGLAALSLLCAWVAQPAPAVTTTSPATPGWTQVERPYPAFALTIPEAADAPASYAIRRHAQGGRKDILTLGEFDSIAPYLRVEVYRPGNEPVRFGDAAAEMLTRADFTPAGLTSEMPVETKFGAVMAARFSVGSRNCLAFVRNHDEPRLQISGWFCQNGEAVERSTLACALDRFTLLAAGGEPKVTALFAHAELNRTFCGQRSPLMAPTPKHRALWKALASG